MRIWLGEEGDRQVLDKVAWIKNAFNEGSYKFTSDGFIYTDYYVTFNNTKYETLFKLKYPK